MPSTRPILEIAVHSYQSALAASSAGADRIELCSALQTGGLTPDFGLLDLVLESVDLPVHILIRPRLGNFVYDKEEMQTILRSIEICKQKKVHGIVVGCLTPGQQIDSAQLEEIVACAQGLDLTFHRAIDVCRDIKTGLEILAKFRFNRVLTSGGARTAMAGLPTIKKMVQWSANDRLSIMPGAGISQLNISEIVRQTGCREIHASAKSEVTLPNQDDIGITSIGGKKINSKWESDQTKIKDMLEIIRQL